MGFLFLESSLRAFSIGSLLCPKPLPETLFGASEQLGSVSRAILLSLQGLEALCDPLKRERRTLGPGKPWEAWGDPWTWEAFGGLGGERDPLGWTLGGTSWEDLPGRDPGRPHR